MILESNDMENGQDIDKKFTCDAEDFSPHLKWREIPEGTKSFALLLLDPKTEYGIVKHWLVHDIPLNITQIPCAGPVPGIELHHDFRGLGYDVPCPESGKHEYIFTIYALDVDHLEEVDRFNFRKKVANHTIEKAEITVSYEREFDFSQFRRSSCHF